METEISAGGIILHATNPQLFHVSLIKDLNGNWTFPKGLVESGEKIEAAAKREIFEEVGLDNLTRLFSLTPVRYYYTRNGLKVRKTVHYFVFESNVASVLLPQHEEGITEAQWFPFSQAKKIIGYPKTNSPLLSEALLKLEYTKGYVALKG